MNMKDDKLSQLEQMLKDGTINQEEYETKKEEILKKENTNNVNQEDGKNGHKKKAIIIVVVCIILAVIIVMGIVGELLKNDVTGVRIDIWTHLTRECIINYVH